MIEEIHMRGVERGVRGGGGCSEDVRWEEGEGDNLVEFRIEVMHEKMRGGGRGEDKRGGGGCCSTEMKTGERDMMEKEDV